MKDLIKYDYTFENERIVELTEYKGFSIKIVYVRNKQVAGYAGIADTGEPYLDSPELFLTQEYAERDVKQFIDKMLEGE